MADRNRLNILQICSAREAIYGAVQSLMTLARAQRLNGDLVEFVTFKGKRFGDQVREEGFVAHEVRVRAKIDPVAILAICRLIKQGRFEIVHTHLSTSSVNGCLAARLAKTPAVATVHGMSGKHSFAAANHLITVSSEIKRHLVAQGVPEGRITPVYNGFDFPTGAIESSVERGAFPVLGTISRITPLKGIEDAIKAVTIIGKEFEGVSFVVVGDGDGLESCKALALELGLIDRVHFVGYQRNIGAYLAGMDLFLFPSLKEGMGIALIEAMAYGLPIVATNVGGIPEVLTPECGIMVEPHSPDALASAALGLLTDKRRRETMGQAGQDRATSVFSVESMRSATESVYRKMLATTRK